MNTGLVIRSTGLWYDILNLENQAILKGRLRGKLKLDKDKLTNPVAVGDKVAFIFDEKNEEEVIIERILPRKNEVIRKSTRKKWHGHVLAANIDLAVIVATISFPRTSLGFIDRFMVATESFEIPSVILFNKEDLLSEEEQEILGEYVSLYEGLGYKCLVTNALEGSIEEVKEIIKNKVVLLAGHSGVGKSTLLNRLIPEANQEVDEVSTFANKGKHTTTFAEMFIADNSTFIIDTPGIKELGIYHLEPSEIGHHMPDLEKHVESCKFHNCNHIEEPGCAVIKAVEGYKIAPSRYKSYISMFFGDDNRK